jgi:hypothetical protein
VIAVWKRFRVGIMAAAFLAVLHSARCFPQDSIQRIEPAGTPLEQLEPLVDPDPASGHPAPQVVYQGGLLSIQVQGSTLAEVLQAVAKATGAAIEMPPASGQEPIVERTGPGPAREVLARLLNGSNFNFIILSAAESPHVLTHIMLSARGGGRPSALEAAAPASSLVAGPQLYGAGFSASPEDEEPSSEIASPAGQGEGQATSGDKISPEVLDQMQKERLRQRQLQMQQVTPPATPQ